MISPLVELFLAQANQRPDQEAVVLGGQFLTYRGLEDRMLACSGYLRGRGVGAGDRVLLFVPPGPELYALILATWRVGAVAVFVDAWTSRHRLGRVAKITTPKLFVGVPKAHLLRLFDASVRRIPSAMWWTGKYDVADALPPADVLSDSTALVTFTTGSTGAPKGADRSHRFLLAQHETLQETLKTRSGSRDLATLPIFGLHDLAAGATCHFAPIDPAKPDSFDVKMFNTQLARSDTSAGSPAVYLSAARRMSVPDPSIHAHIHLGGAAVFPETIQTLAKAYPNARWQAVYGSTEAEPIASLDGQELASWSRDESQGLPAGTPSPAISIRILTVSDEPLEAATERELDALQAPDGVIGEIVVSGDHVLASYWNDPDAQRRNKIRTEERVWHRTGDAGRQDATGALFLHGRVADRIRFQGVDHYPLAFERRLRALKGVEAGCVVQGPNQIFVVVQAKRGQDLRELRARVVSLPWPFPVEIVFREIPRDPRHRSKLDIGLLKRQLLR